MAKRISPKLITVSGVDGSGKSTQIELLRASLEQTGLSVSVRWFRPGYSDRLNKIRDLVRKTRPSALPPADPSSEARAKLFESGKIQFAWVAAAILDTWIEYAVAARLAASRSDVVIYDRHLPDADLDLRLNFPQQTRIATAGLAVVRATMRAPDRQLLLQVPFEVSEDRRRAKNEPFPETDADARRRFAQYDASLERWTSAIAIDANQPVSRVAVKLALLCAPESPIAEHG